MKNLLTLSLLAGSIATHAQITITAAQYPATAATVDRYQSATPATLTAPQPGANQTWDYRTLTPQGVVTSATYNSISGTAPFTGSVRTYSFVLPLGSFNIAATAYEGFETVGFSQLGTVTPAQSFPLTGITGGASDVLAIPAQSGSVNTLRIPLPLTSTTRVARFNRLVNSSLLTVQAYGLNQASFRYVQRIATVDSAVGWGTLRIPVAGSPAGSAALPVLLVDRRYIQQDSFYLGTQPAPVQLLSALGQTQGTVTRTYRQYFYRQNAAQYVLGFSYPSATFTGPTSASYSAESTITLAAAAARELASGGLLAWPNPTAGSQAIRFSLASLAVGQPLCLTLRDATGRMVARTLVANEQPATLPALPAGLYLAEATGGDVRASCRLVVE